MGLEVILLAAISVALGVLAFVTAQRLEADSVFRDQKPTTTVQRGARIDRLIGRQRIGPKVLWAGSRWWQNVRKGKNTKILEWFEARWDAIALGPGERFYRIVQDGRSVFEGPIDRTNTPNGTRFQLAEGAFRIWWGEQNQTPNLCLALTDELQGDWSDGIGITSRWPFLMYIYWEYNNIGNGARWGLYEYEVEVRPIGEGTHIASSPGWIEGDRTLLLDPRYQFVIHDGEGIGKTITVYSSDDDSQALDALAPTRFVRISGGTPIDGDHEIATVERIQLDHDGTFWTPRKPGAILHFVDEDWFAGGGGICAPYTEASGDGVNPVVAFDELLFGPYPHGAGLPIDEISISSLEAGAQLAQVEGLAASIHIKDGKELKTVVAEILQDLGFGFPLDTVSGLYRLFPLRNTADPSDIFEITEDMLTKLPEIETLLIDKPVNRVIYAFRDRARSFRDMTIAIDDDGEANFIQHQKARKIPIRIFIEFVAASKVAERRSQEDLAGAGKTRLWANRSARKLYPALPVTCEGVPGVLRILGVTVDPDKSETVIDVMPDFLGVAPPTFTNRDSDQGKDPPVFSPQPDLFFNFIERPGYLNKSGSIELMVARIRAHNQITFADIWISEDDSSYFVKNREFDLHTGGALEAELAASSPTFQAEGPIITVVGPDISNALDLSADEAGWARGDQWCVFEDEICYVQKLTNLGGGSYRLDGLLRARLGTKQVTHVIGTPAFIFAEDEIAVQEDTDGDLNDLLDDTLYVKSQPSAGDWGVELGDITSQSKTLKGRGVIAPLNTDGLIAGQVFGSNAYETGDDIPIEWSYRSTEGEKTGAGMQGAGNTVSASPVQGEFVVTIKTTGDVVQRTISGLTSPSYTYTNANLQADFSGEPASFKIEVKNIDAELSSDPEEITVVKE